jgi:hypothetical protein
MLGYFYRVIIEYCTIVVGVENPHKFWMCRSLATLDKLVDKFTLPPEAPPIGDTSLTHVMKLAAHSTTPPTPTTMVQYFYYDGITLKHSNSPIHFKLTQIPSSFHIWQKQYGTTVQYIHTNWDKLFPLTLKNQHFIEKEFCKKYKKKRSSFTQIWYRKLP